MGRRKQYSEPPQTEIDLARLQQEYLKPNCSQSVKDEYFLLLRIYARSITLKEIKHKNIYLPPERVDEICTDATLLMLNQYKKEGWRVEASFAGALRWKVVEAMYGSAQEDMVFSLNSTFTEDNDSKEIMDLVGSGSALPWRAEINSNSECQDPVGDMLLEVNVAYDEIKALINQAYDMLPYPTFMRFLPWLLLQIRKPRTKNVLQLFNNLFLTNREENAFDILLLEARNRIAAHTGISFASNFIEE